MRVYSVKHSCLNREAQDKSDVVMLFPQSSRMLKVAYNYFRKELPLSKCFHKRLSFVLRQSCRQIVAILFHNDIVNSEQAQWSFSLFYDDGAAWFKAATHEPTLTVVNVGRCFWRPTLTANTDLYSRRRVKRLAASVCDSLWAYLSVCPHEKLKRMKLQSPNLLQGYSPSRVLARQLILGQKVKGQGHRVTKYKNILKAIEWSVGMSLHFYLVYLVFSSLVNVVVLSHVCVLWRYTAALSRPCDGHQQRRHCHHTHCSVDDHHRLQRPHLDCSVTVLPFHRSQWFATFSDRELVAVCGKPAVASPLHCRQPPSIVGC